MKYCVFSLNELSVSGTIWANFLLGLFVLSICYVIYMVLVLKAELFYSAQNYQPAEISLYATSQLLWKDISAEPLTTI